MKQHPTAGARIRMTLEGIVRDAYQPGVFTLGDGTHVSYTPGQHAVTILAPGWEPGDKIETEYGTLIRVVDDEGYAHWRDFYDSSVTFHDDQLYMDDVRVLHRVTPPTEQPPAVDPAARWQAAADLVTRAREKGVSRIDADLIAEALGLDEVAAPAPAADELAPGTYWLSTRTPAAPSPDSPHDFDAEYLGEVDAKRRLPKCRCGEKATAAVHDGDQSEETRHLRMLLNA